MKRAWFLMVSGVLLTAVSVAALVLFWFVGVPGLQSQAPELDPSQSFVGLWKQRERLLKVGLWAHDDGWRVGEFGGKEWAKPLIDSLLSAEGLGCSSGHREVGICYIANREPEENEKLGENWLKWWNEHKDESQEQWIRDGFAALGVVIALPPDAKDWDELLKVLGAEPGPMPPGYEYTRKLYPQSARYNAYRWLRDSGFEPVQYLIGRSGHSLDPTVRLGIEAYERRAAGFQTEMPGKLAFAPPFEGWGFSRDREPLALRGGPQAAFTLVSGVMAFCGLWLMRKGLRRKRNQAQQALVVREP